MLEPEDPQFLWATLRWLRPGLAREMLPFRVQWIGSAVHLLDPYLCRCRLRYALASSFMGSSISGRSRS